MFGIMKKGWEVKKLGEVLQKTETIDPTKNPEKDFVYVDVSSVNNQNFSIENTTLLQGKDAPSRARKLIKTNDVIFATVRPTLKRVAIIPEELNEQVCSTGYFVLRGKEFIENKYLFYFLLSSEFINNMEKLQKGASYPAVTDGEVREQVIQYPKDKAEQQSIVTLLDVTFAAIEQAKVNVQRCLSLSKDLFQSELNSIFSQKGEGWVEKKLKDICYNITDGTHQTPKYFDSGYIFLSSGNVTSGKIDWNKIKYIDEKQHIEMHKRVSPQVGDILLAKNGTTGVAAMVDRDVPFDIYVSLALIRTLGEVSSTYLLYFINSPLAKSQFNKRLKGIGVPNLHLEEIREVNVNYPTSSEIQRQIVQRLDALSAETKKLEAKYQAKLTALEELKKSVLEKAFSGGM
jgi:type I restriction enzyme S subunit